ncbi:MAG: hypothetical protein AVDCRST_MAG53-969 [uncultured Solirubrobacteraceae bacterium]|uniref:Uncharacterized protein n=1 Tax=uncultured Solirubrobacteraceae bacterium TaxID=1162706 RepID=A0A6J4S3Q5_9ACTN|nr:MAG: hypothetical protein AVDCRST_MAG53-969 [uncultured Solirubrobacteraceae bacterium]
MSDLAIFTRHGERFVPTAHAVGPWDPGQLHGGAPAGLAPKPRRRGLSPDGHGDSLRRRNPLRRRSLPGLV